MVNKKRWAVRVIEEELNGLIIRYFRLSYKIKRDEKRIIGAGNKYRNQSYHTRTEMTPEGTLRVKAFNIENEVCGYLTDCYYIEQRLKEKQKKQRYFTDYLHNLTPDKRAYLFNRYVEGLSVIINEGIERDTVEEINEIETAIIYMRGEEPDKLIGIEDGTELEFDELLDVLGV